MMLDVLNHVPQRKAPIICSSCGHATGIIAGVMWIGIFIKDVDKENSEGLRNHENYLVITGMVVVVVKLSNVQG